VSIDPDTFRSVLSRFASGVTVVSARDHAEIDHGMTVSAFCSVSLEPPLVLACVDHEASMHAVLLAVEHFGVSVLSAAQEPLSRHFADPASNRWAGVRLHQGMTGVPLVDDAVAHLECRMEARHRTGDHTIFIGRVLHAAIGNGEPLIYFRGGYTELHH
jgi:flavin reductase (DIM6/NTAB) family NADH-FMN oxidoreductase RutF